MLCIILFRLIEVKSPEFILSFSSLIVNFNLLWKSLNFVCKSFILLVQCVQVQLSAYRLKKWMSCFVFLMILSSARFITICTIVIGEEDIGNSSNWWLKLFWYKNWLKLTTGFGWYVWALSYLSDYRHIQFEINIHKGGGCCHTSLKFSLAVGVQNCFWSLLQGDNTKNY